MALAILALLAYHGTAAEHCARLKRFRSRIARLNNHHRDAVGQGQCLFQQADAALYRAKSDGRNRIFWDHGETMKERETGIEPATTSLGSCNAPVASGDSKALASTPSAACTCACTSEGENANADAPETASVGTPPQAADALDTGHQGEGEGGST